MATYVLVHGAFHGGWCWRDVAARLREAGHLVFTPTLTGLGERAHLASPAVGLSTHIQDVLAVLRWEGLADAVLVGHSYGGAVISGVADRAADRLRALVYLDAAVPHDGVSVLEHQPAERGRHMQELVAGNDGWRLPPYSAEFYGVSDPEKQRWVDALCVPQPFATFRERAVYANGGPEAVARKLYILCTDPPLPVMRQFYDEVRVKPGWDAIELATGHDAMVTVPDELARILSRYA
jgi:pimeloyl-ACP methyl ester carboxylesterase